VCRASELSGITREGSHTAGQKPEEPSFLSITSARSPDVERALRSGRR
jgi:hypothetical protein